MSATRKAQESLYGIPRFGWLCGPVVLLFVLPFLCAVAAVIATDRWVEEHNLTSALTASLTVLAMLYVRDVVDTAAASQRNRGSRSPDKATRFMVGTLALVAILLVIAHFLIAGDDGVASGVRHFVRWLAVSFVVAATGWFMAIRSLRLLLESPDPPVLLSTRLRTAALHLVLPVTAVAVAFLCFNPWFVRWWVVGVAQILFVCIWQIALVRAEPGGRALRRHVRITDIRSQSPGTNAPPTWWQYMIRASMIGAVVALPASVGYTMVGLLMGHELRGLPPAWLVGASPLPAIILLLSTVANCEGRGLHDLLARTVLVTTEMDERNQSQPDIWRPYW